MSEFKKFIYEIYENLYCDFVTSSRKEEKNCRKVGDIHVKWGHYFRYIGWEI